MQRELMEGLLAYSRAQRYVFACHEVTAIKCQTSWPHSVVAYTWARKYANWVISSLYGKRVNDWLTDFCFTTQLFNLKSPCCALWVISRTQQPANGEEPCLSVWPSRHFVRAHFMTGRRQSGLELWHLGPSRARLKNSVCASCLLSCGFYDNAQTLISVEGQLIQMFKR